MHTKTRLFFANIPLQTGFAISRKDNQQSSNDNLISSAIMRACICLKNSGHSLFVTTEIVVVQQEGNVSRGKTISENIIENIIWKTCFSASSKKKIMNPGGEVEI